MKVQKMPFTFNPSVSIIDLPKKFTEIRLACGDYVIIRKTLGSGKLVHHLAVKETYANFIIEKARQLLGIFDSGNTGKMLTSVKQTMPVYGLHGEGHVVVFQFITLAQGVSLLPSKIAGAKFRIIYFDREGRNGVSLAGLESINNEDVFEGQYDPLERDQVLEFI